MGKIFNRSNLADFFSVFIYVIIMAVIALLLLLFFQAWKGLTTKAEATEVSTALSVTHSRLSGCVEHVKCVFFADSLNGWLNGDYHSTPV